MLISAVDALYPISLRSHDPLRHIIEHAGIIPLPHVVYDTHQTCTSETVGRSRHAYAVGDHARVEVISASIVGA